MYLFHDQKYVIWKIKYVCPKIAYASFKLEVYTEWAESYYFIKGIHFSLNLLNAGYYYYHRDVSLVYLPHYHSSPSMTSRCSLILSSSYLLELLSPWPRLTAMSNDSRETYEHETFIQCVWTYHTGSNIFNYGDIVMKTASLCMDTNVNFQQT